MSMSASQKTVLIWFLLDAFLILCPVNYALLSGTTTTILGLPWIVMYFVLSGACVVASVIYAYIVDSREEGLVG